MVLRTRVFTAVFALTFAGPAVAQGNPPSRQSLKDPAACNQAAKAEPATQPAPASADGTAPGNAGSTGWSGGTGGSYIGTTSAGATGRSKTYQPATARGLDPIAAPVQPAAASC